MRYIVDKNNLYVLDENKRLHKNAKEIKYYIDSNGCHICISHRRNAKGYPTKRFNNSSTTMVRYVWFLNTNKTLIKDEFVCHKCDNPNCINFKHLFVGSNSDNVNDKVKKNRQARHSNLSDEDIYNIKINTINTSKELSNIYLVSDTIIRDIWNGKVHKNIHVDNYEFYCKERKKRNKSRKGKLTKEDISKIKELLREGNMTHREIGELFSVARGVVTNIKKEHLLISIVGGM